MTPELAPLNISFAPLMLEAVSRLFEIGAVEVDLEKGIELREHRLGSDAPRTPIFFNLRDPTNPKPGVLSEKEYLMLSRVMLLYLESNRVSFDALAPIPNAGTPFAYAMQKLLSPQRHVPVVPIEKQGESIVLGDIVAKLRDGARVLLVDDVISDGGSKEGPIHALRAARCIVSDCSVFIDRQQKGRANLGAHKVRVYAPVTTPAAVRIGVSKGYVSTAVERAVLEYVDACRM